jgi:sporulation protein YlmC with PRC-barrel domain
MLVKLGMSVRTSDGEDVGKIEKLILDPASGDVKAAVIRKGFILTDDVEVPVDLLEADTESQARLQCTAEQVKDLPRFDESIYTTLPTDYPTPYGYPPGGFFWPVGYPIVPPYPATGVPPTDEAYGSRVPEPVMEARRETVLHNAVIEEGSDVKDRAGEKIGELHRLTFDPDSGEPTGIVVRKGFLFTEDVPLPADLIESASDGEIHLSIYKDEAERISRSAV